MGLTRNVCELPTDFHNDVYGLVGHQRFAVGHWVSKNRKKLSPNKTGSAYVGFERNEDHRVNLCTKEILAHIWVKIGKLTRSMDLFRSWGAHY